MAKHHYVPKSDGIVLSSLRFIQSNTSTFILFLLFAVTLQACSFREEDVLLQNPTCEYASDPLGIEVPQPKLGWQIVSEREAVAQSAYRIIVASSPELLKQNRGDVWDSSKTPSDQSQQVRYSGATLRSAQHYYWKVQIWDEQGRASAWSKPARWAMGILSPQEWQGKWISNRFAEVSDTRAFFDSWSKDADYQPSDTAAVYLRKKVNIPERVKQATAFICGLGYYELYVNGDKAGTRLMDPAFSDYQQTVYYAVHDVTSLVQKGDNALGIILGNGFYNLPEQDFTQMEKAWWKTPPKTLMNLRITYESGRTETFCTDGTWRWSDGEITYNSIRGGETIDHTKQQKGWNGVSFDDSRWTPLIEVPPPTGKLKAQLLPPMRATEEFAPIRITEPKQGVYLVDFGENMTGWIELHVKGERG
jgi:alpha-L-rhamnosidase